MVSTTQLREYNEFKECIETIKDVKYKLDYIYKNKPI